MPNAERISELQRLAYGAGSTDHERHAALDELEAIRRGRGPAIGGGAAEGDTSPPDASGVTGDSDSAGRASDWQGVLGLPAAADAEAGDPRSDGEAPARTIMRWAVMVGAIALTIGFGAGWAGASIAAAGFIAEAEPPGGDPGDEQILFPLAEAPEDDVPVDETRAAEMFSREPTEADLAVDPQFFGDEGIDADSRRLLSTRSDGASVWAARTDDGDLCLLLRLDESTGASTCTVDGMFPSTGLAVDAYFEGDGYHGAWLDQYGDLRIRAEGVAGPPPP